METSSSKNDLFCFWCKDVIAENDIKVSVPLFNQSHAEYHYYCFESIVKYNMLDKEQFDLLKQIRPDLSNDRNIMNPINAGFDRRIELILDERKHFIKTLNLNKMPTTGELTKKMVIESQQEEKKREKVLKKSIDHSRYDTIDKFKKDYKHYEDKRKVLEVNSSKLIDESSNNNEVDETSDMTPWERVSAMFQTVRKSKQSENIPTKNTPVENLEESERLITLQLLYDTIPFHYEGEYILHALSCYTDVNLLLKNGISISKIMQDIPKINIYFFFSKGYKLSDLVLLGLTWNQMKQLNFNYLIWSTFKYMINIDIIVDFFQCNMSDMISDVFYDSVLNIISVKFTFDEMVKMQCTATLLQSIKLRTEDIKKFGFTNEQWIQLKADREFLKYI